MDRNFGVFLPASKAGCTYIRDGWTTKTLHNCSVSDDVFLEYARDNKDNIQKYWAKNYSIRCCLRAAICGRS